MRPTVLATFAMGLGFSACTFLRPTDDFTNGGPADASAGESGSDSGTESGAESGTDSGVGFCATQVPAPLLCADFDQNNLLGAFASGTPTTLGTDQSPNATISSDHDGDSSPTALAVTTPATNAMGGLHAVITPPGNVSFAATAPTKKVTLRFALRIAALPNTIHTDLVTLVLTGHDGSTFHLFLTAADGSGLLFLESEPSNAVVTFALPTLGTWHTVTIELTPASYAAGVMIDDQVVASTSATPASAIERVSFALGLWSESPSDLAEIAIDDVVFDRD